MSLAIDNTYSSAYNSINITSKNSKTNTSKNEDTTNKEEENNKTTIIKIQDDDFYYIYSINEDGKRTLIQKLPIPVSKKNFTSQKTKNMITTNPKLTNLAVINNCKAAMKFNQEMLKGRHQNNDIDDMMKLLLSM